MLIYAFNGFRAAQGTFHFAEMPADVNKKLPNVFLNQSIGNIFKSLIEANCFRIILIIQTLFLFSFFHFF